MAESKDFTVKDRRAFSQDDPQNDGDESSPSQPETEAEPASEAADSKVEEQAQPPLPEINFSTFIMSLNASALVSLGVIEDPASGEKSGNLSVGKQTIDILGMLEEKTKGNLTEDEAQMLKSILYELRMLYVREKG